MVYFYFVLSVCFMYLGLRDVASQQYFFAAFGFVMSAWFFTDATFARVRKALSVAVENNSEYVEDGSNKKDDENS